ncbi:MAG: hypothetical protein SNJ77_03660 [Cytophagales bacterium]
MLFQGCGGCPLFKNEEKRSENMEFHAVNYWNVYENQNRKYVFVNELGDRDTLRVMSFGLVNQKVNMCNDYSKALKIELVFDRFGFNMDYSVRNLIFFAGYFGVHFQRSGEIIDVNYCKKTSERSNYCNYNTGVRESVDTLCYKNTQNWQDYFDVVVAKNQGIVEILLPNDKFFRLESVVE